MREFILSLLQAVIAAAVPVVAAFLCRWLDAKRKDIVATSEGVAARVLMDDAIEAVQRAVAVANQKYVDALKKQGKFSVENQKEAFRLAYDTAFELMSQDAANFIDKAYGSVSAWLTAQIEAEVQRRKNSYSKVDD